MAADISSHHRLTRALISSLDTHVRRSDGCRDRGQGTALRRHVRVPVLLGFRVQGVFDEAYDWDLVTHPQRYHKPHGKHG